MQKRRQYFSSVAFSDSLARLKLSSPAQTLTRRLVAKKPEPSPAVCDMPSSRKCAGDNRAFGFGFSSFLYAGKIDSGIAPREAAVGGGCGGCAVAGGARLGLKAK